ncbi:hypothetical protein CAPTEDRAFT_212374 [Capitella teleta]|uniref:Uncharacterized protein n=1 Tax=Capitella teleta TaxID=283909 RepID=R7UZ69_CAPTE|nr:hypothetical protein CAPTEDRAFT_212374 [Capitella teleta]|eukprot:ELU08711.1 hypothetical protein CAPTEDRAFT_212374 [Capitella teleta]
MASSPCVVVTRSRSVRSRRSTPLPKRRSLSFHQPQVTVSCDIDFDLPRSHSVASLPPLPTTLSATANRDIEPTLAQPPTSSRCDVNSSHNQSSSSVRCGLNFSLPQLPTASGSDLNLTSILPSAASSHLNISSIPTPRRPRLGLSSLWTSTPAKLTESCLASDLSITLPSARRLVPRTTLRPLTPRYTDLPLPVDSTQDRVSAWLQTPSTPERPDVINREEPERSRTSCFSLYCCAQQSTEMSDPVASKEENMAKRKNEENDKKEKQEQKREDKEKKKKEKKDKHKMNKNNWRLHIKRIKNNLRNIRRISVDFLVIL